METYEEILTRMQQNYEELSGHPVAQVSDSDFRLRAMAGEVYRLQAQLAWLKAQAFPFSAQGEWLDQHGALRGVSRREAVASVGTLTFSRYLPLSFDVVIPKGTCCATTGEDPLEFTTTEDVTLAAGELTVSAPAKAVTPGTIGNAAAGTINTPVTETDAVEYVTNTAAFTGGADAEDDAVYRVRVMQSYREPTTALNAAWYERAALESTAVTAAQAVARENGANTVSVYCWGAGTAPESSELTALQQRFSAERDIGVTVTVKAASSTTVNVKLRLRVADGANFELARRDAALAVQTCFAGVSVGDGITLETIRRAVMQDPAVEKLEFPSTMHDVSAAVGVLPQLGTVTVEEV